MVVAEAGPDSCLQWAKLSSGHTSAQGTLAVTALLSFLGTVSTPGLSGLRSAMQSIVDSCACHASKQSHSGDREVISSLPIPYCAKPSLCVDYIDGLPGFGSYGSCLVVTCGWGPFTRAFPCSKRSQG